MKTIGERIHYCRKLLNLTRNEVADEYQEVTLSTLERWENDKVQVKERNILAFIKYLTIKGLPVTLEWLRYGAGNPPMLFRQNNDGINMTFDEVANLSAEHIRGSTANFIYFQVNNNLFEPILRYGDYAGGIICENLDLLNGKLCFYKNHKSVIVGFLNLIDDNNFSVVGFNKSDIKQFTRDDNGVFGELNWLMRRFD